MFFDSIFLNLMAVTQERGNDGGGYLMRVALAETLRTGLVEIEMWRTPVLGQ